MCDVLPSSPDRASRIEANRRVEHAVNGWCCPCLPMTLVNAPVETSSELMRRAAFDQVPLGHVLQTSDGTLRAVNRSLCLLLGYSEAEMLTLTVPELREPEANAHDWAQYRALLAGQIESFSLAKRTFSRCDRAIWGSLSLSLSRDSAGQIEWIVSRLHEIKPGQSAEKTQNDQQEQQNLLEEMARVGSWELDPETGAATWSSQYFRICGLAPAALIPSLQNGLDLIAPADREGFERLLAQVLELHQPREYACCLLRPDGSMRHVLFQMRLQPLKQGALRVAGLLVDVHEQWLLTQQAKQSQLRLAQQNRELEQMMRMATHNLRSPLANAISLTQMLDEADSAAERQAYQQLLAQSLAQTLRNLEELEGQHAVSLPEAPLRQPVLFQTTLDRVLIVLGAEIHRSQAVIHVDFTCPGLDYVLVYFNSILYNLVSNALKYRSPDRLLQLDLRSWRADGQVFLEVQDNGLGIDLEKHEQHLFQLHQVFSQHADAHGVGLYLTYHQVEFLGGEITVTSEPGQGSCFRIRF